MEAIEFATSSGPTLLVVDNCEHVVDVCAQPVGELLESVPTLTVLATSREHLEVKAEQVVEPEHREAVAVDMVTLFCDRGRRCSRCSS